MKKIALFLTVILTVTMLSGCGGEDAQTEVQPATNSNNQQNETTIVPVNEIGTLESGVDNEQAGEELENFKTVINSADRSVDDCNKLENEYKEKCLAIVYTELAEESLDNSSCAKITLPDLQNECMARVEGLKTPPVLLN